MAANKTKSKAKVPVKAKPKIPTKAKPKAASDSRLDILEKEVKALSKAVKAKEKEIQALKDVNNINNLMAAYVYYLEYGMGKEIIDFVEKNFDDVGCDFAKEALKIHYGVEEPRNIRGISTKEEEKMLKEEGIDFVKIPMPALPDTDA